MVRVAVLLLSTLVAATSQSDWQDRRYTRRDNDIQYNVFEHADTGGKIRYVNNSGICETTPNVAQASGYFDVGKNRSMFFWYFAARNDASRAPLTIWLNGGPGCSSLVGLFQENGPCHFVNGEKKPSLNPYSWNNYSNMVYIDQPIGTGFSYGTNDVKSTLDAAPFVWNFMQAFLGAFPEFQNRNLGLFTESYGGHYAPAFASYFQAQNQVLDTGSVKGYKLKLVAMGISNAWLDATRQYAAYPEYSLKNDYRSLISESLYKNLTEEYKLKCAPALAQCTGPEGQDDECAAANSICSQAIEVPIYNSANFSVYDIRQPDNDPNPPNDFVDYLQRKDIMKAIGAQVPYEECQDEAFQAFFYTGDWTRSFLKPLSDVVQSGIQVVLWAGNADWICNWVGNLAFANTVTYSGTSQFANKAVAPYTVKGTKHGEFKNVDNLSWLKMYDAGHEVPYYQPQAAYQVFVQTMQQQPLSST